MRAASRSFGWPPSLRRIEVTGIVDRLEVRGLVTRRGRPGDRRMKELALTPSGAEMRRRVETALETMPGVSNLSATDLRRLRDLLDRALT